MEELKNKFEVAALGCLDTYQYYKFLQSLDDELKEEFGKYQKIASLIPLSLELEQPTPEVKNKVVIGIKEIILEKSKQTKLVEILRKEHTEIKPQESSKIKGKEETDKRIIQESPIFFETVDREDDKLIPKEKNIKEKLKEPVAQSVVNREIIQEKEISSQSEIKVNLNYISLLKEEIAEEIIKRNKKTIQIQFEELDYKFNKKNKSIKIFLIIITLLLLLLTAFNVYQFLYPIEKKVEIKKEIKTPLIDKPDSLL